MKNKNDLEIIHNEIFDALSPWRTVHTLSQSLLSEFEEEACKIEELLTRTLTHGESNSLLVIGPRGCGKTSLIKAVAEKLKDKNILDLGLIVNLSGLLQTDDRLALQEITRQLSVDGEKCKFGSFAENLSFILRTLQNASSQSSKPVIFILDEFDLFCYHRNQTLLYNLFDISQSAKAPISVIGLTSRLDVIELLEKRVKSRFSHRQVFLFPKGKFEGYLETAKALMKIHSSAQITKNSRSAWNEKVNKVFGDSEVLNLLKSRFCLNRDIRDLKSFLLLVVSQLNEASPWPTKEEFQKASVIISQDAKKKMLQSLSILQLSLLIAMKNLHAIYDGEPFNFEMVFRKYNKFGECHSSMASYERPVVFKAFDHLECLELIRPVDSSRSTLQREYRLMQLLVTPDLIEETIQSSPNLPTFLANWCTSDVI